MTGIMMVIAYHVEILSGLGAEWTFVHGPDWESTTDLMLAIGYAEQVRKDYPDDTEVRIVKSEDTYRLESSTNAGQMIIR